MQNSDHEAKKRLLVNVGTNMMAVFVGALINLWITPYLIRNLGLEVYGMIPLVISFIACFNLFTMSIVNAVSRYVSIHLNKGELEQSNIYFNSALSALLALCGILLIPIITISIFFSNIFQIPVGFEVDAGWLFFFIMLSSFIMVLRSPFQVSTFVTHRFALNSSVEIISKSLRLIVLVLCFTFLTPALKYFGVSYLAMTLFALSGSVILTKYLTPQLKLKIKSFRWSAIRELGHMSFWMTVNQVGGLLYLSVSFIIINLFLGPEEVGRFGPVVLWITLLGALSGTFSNVFTPIAYEYIAHERRDILALQTQRSIKFLALMMGFPVGLLCGLSTPILQRWLGQEFADLGPLVWLLIGPWLVTAAVRPMFAIYRGLDKVKVPAIITLVVGIVNAFLSILLIRYTDLGIYSVALSLLFCWTGKNLFFTPVYTALITGQPKTIFIRQIVPGFIMATIVSLSALTLSRMYDLASIPRLLSVCLLMIVAYSFLCYGIISKGERALLWSLIYRKK